MEIELITKAEAFEGLQATWDAVLQRSPANSIFLTHAWLRNWLHHYGASGRLYVLVVREGSEIIGIAPLMIRKREGFNRLASIGQETLDHENWILLEAADHKTIVHRLTKFILADHSWDLWQFNRLPVDTVVLENLKHTLNSTNVSWASGASDKSPYIQTTGEWENYRMSLPKVFRSNFERRLRKLKQDYEQFDFAEVSCEEEAEKTLQSLFEIHRRRHQAEAGGGSFFDNAQTRKFYMELTRNLERAGWLRMPFISINGQIIAVQLGFEYAGTYYSKLSAIDMDYAKYAIGDLLNVLILQRCFEKQVKVFDFLRGDGAYKLKFEPLIRELHSLTVFAPTMRGMVAKQWFEHIRPLCKENKLIQQAVARSRMLSRGS